MQYNLHMGGVDLADMLTLLYCIKLGSKKAYMRLIFFCLNTAVVNAWLLYCRHSDQLKIRQKDVMSLIVFQSKVANSLMKRRKVIEKMKRGRTSLTPSEPAPISKLGRKTVAPHADVCFDFVDHFPCFIDKQQKCILCCQRRTNGYTFVKCSKCNGRTKL
uniref:PiggyBac transposable element-derived protein domain-containing protein n=1 Tax=Romanomermis culicivorax TaxID=13658 RepID=A0A915IDI1_ROMCU